MRGGEAPSHDYSPLLTQDSHFYGYKVLSEKGMKGISADNNQNQIVPSAGLTPRKEEPGWTNAVVRGNMSSYMQPDKYRQTTSTSGQVRSAQVALLCTMAGAVTLASLIPFGTLSSCSPGRVALFLVLLGISAALVLSGLVVGSISYRRSRSRLALFSLLFALVYAALLIYLLGLAS